MIVVVVTADMSGEQPGHVVAELAVFAWPECEVKMIGHQAKSQYAHWPVEAAIGVMQARVALAGDRLADRLSTIFPRNGGNR